MAWLGHPGFRLQSPTGRSLLIDPWLKNNPACPHEFKTKRQADLRLVTHGHCDHFADVVELADSLNKPAVR